MSDGDQNQKKDAGKPIVSLILGGFRRALEGVSRVGEFGMRKYTRNGWDKVDNWRNRYGEALGRHALEVQEGVNYARDTYDPETGLLSELALAWNALALAELKLREGVPLRKPEPCGPPSHPLSYTCIHGEALKEDECCDDHAPRTCVWWNGGKAGRPDAQQCGLKTRGPDLLCDWHKQCAALGDLDAGAPF